MDPKVNHIRDNKRIAKNTLMLYVRMFLIMGVTLYTSRIVLAELGVEDYGIFNVVGGVVIMFSFLNSAMALSTQRFLSFELVRGDAERLEKTFKTAITIHVIIGMCVVFLSETIGLWFINNVMSIPLNKISSANWVYQFAILGYVISILQVPFNAAIIARESMSFYAYIGIVDVLVRLGVAFAVGLFYNHKLECYSVLIFCVSVLNFLIYYIYCKKRYSECQFSIYYEKIQFREMSSYAVWSTLGSLAWVGKLQGVNIILNIFFGPLVNAAFGVANQVNTAVNSFVQNFNTAINPQIVKNYSIGDYSNMKTLITYGAKFSYFLMLLLAFPVLIATDDILHLWLEDVPQYTVVFSQLVIVNSLIESISYSMGTGIQATGKIKWYQLTVGITLLLNLPVSFLFLKNGFPPYVVFVVSIFFSAITVCERLIILKNNIPGFSILLFCQGLLVPIFFVTCICGLIYSLIQHAVVINLCLTILLSVIIVFLVEFIFGITRQERSFIWGFVKSKI